MAGANALFCSHILFVMVAIVVHCVRGTFDCSTRRCCHFLSSVPAADSSINCLTLSLDQCVQHNLECEWDCTPTISAQRNMMLRQAGYTLKRFLKVSNGEGEYHEPKISGDGPPVSHHNEPQTADEMVRWSRMSSIDECGVVYEYQMDNSSAQNALDRILTNTGNAQSNLFPFAANQERLIRRLTVFGNDGRVQVQNQAAYQYTGYLQFSTKGGDEKRCTATLVSENFIITAGHCVHSGYGPGTYPEWFHNWRFYPGLVHENQMKALEIVGIKAYAFSEWTSDYGPNWDYDIALVELNTVDAGITPLGIGYDDTLSNRAWMTTVGYPGDMSWLTKWSQVCSWNYVLDEFMATDNCDIAPGSSGSPVYKYNRQTGTEQILCIVSWENDYFNGCARITSSKYSSLCSWLGCK